MGYVHTGIGTTADEMLQAIISCVFVKQRRVIYVEECFITYVDADNEVVVTFLETPNYGSKLDWYSFPLLDAPR